MGDFFDTLEDFRLYCVSFWPDLYVLIHELSPGSLWSEFSDGFCLWFHQLPAFSKFWFLFSVLAVLLTIGVKLYTKLTCGICKSKAKLNGQTVLITGANSGIGYETALDLAKRGARVVLGCRNMDRGLEAVNKIKIESNNKNVVVQTLDLSSIASVRKSAREFLKRERRLDILILNAGIALTKKYLTEDNFEVHMASNHFGHFLLTNLLAPLLVNSSMKKANPGRIVVVSSLAHWWGKIELDNLNSERSYDSSRVYGNTKLANVLFTKELARRLKNSNIIVNAIHPGAVQTGLFRHIPYFGPIFHFFAGLAIKNPKEGAQTTIFAAVDESLDNVTGEYFSDCKPCSHSNESKDLEMATRLWNRSVEILEMDRNEVIPMPKKN